MGNILHHGEEDPQGEEVPPPFDKRGVRLEFAEYGDLERQANTADVTAPLAAILRCQRSSGSRHFYFKLKQGSKNSLPGFKDPYRGHRKKLRMVFSVDGRSQTFVIDEYSAFGVASEFYLPKTKAKILEKQTYWQEEELQLLYEAFRAISWPEHRFKRKQFHKLLPVFDESPDLTKSLFTALSDDADAQSLSFERFAWGLSTMIRGSPDERTELSYKIIDLDKNGFIERDEMKEVCSLLTTLMSSLGIEQEGVSETQHNVDLLFQRQGTDSNANLENDYAMQSLNAAMNDVDIQHKKRDKQQHEENAEHPHREAIKDKLKEGLQKFKDKKEEYIYGKEKEKAIIMDSNDWRPRDSPDDDEFEPEENAESELFMARLSDAEFKERAFHEPDLVNCFGMFEFFFRTVLQPIDDILDSGTGTERRLQGWLSKDKGQSPFYQTLSLLTLDKRWFVVENGCLAYFRSNKDKEPIRVVDLTEGQVMAGPDKASWFYLKTPCFARHLYASSRKEMKLWVRVLRNNFAQGVGSNRFRSFAPVRHGIGARWFVNGEEYFAALADMIPRARNTIYIADWYFSPGLYLIRAANNGGTLNPYHRLDNLLTMAAEKGVKVYIMIWNAPQFAGFALESKYVTEYMSSLHKNIKAIRHPTFTPITWSHHQKFVVIDEVVAFVGGIDLCYNRYENSKYNITDEDSSFFPGRDYGNLNYAGEANGKSFDAVLDRKSVPRMPWHDVQVQVDGAAAKDVAWNFIQRWNHAMQTGSGSQLFKPVFIFPSFYSFHRRQSSSSTLSLSTGSRLSLPVTTSRSSLLAFASSITSSSSSSTSSASSAPTSFRNSTAILKEFAKEINEQSSFSYLLPDSQTNSFSNCTCQVVRSVSSWSAGKVEREQSVYRAYLSAIKNAKHFIYIENQYFISSICRIRPKNRIAHALFERLCKAIREKEAFKVIVVLPVYPAGDLLSASTRYIIKYVYKTVSRQGNSLLEKLQAAFPDVNISHYVSFHSLRNYGALAGKAITEQVYIHAKVMIVDDRLAIIGSANINDRSMRGTRDSEICVVVEQEEKDFIPSTMGGQPFMVSPFAHSLRRRLWEDYLGAHSDAALCEMIADPVADDVYFGQWLHVSQKNTETYLMMFRSLPDEIYTLSGLEERKQLEAQCRKEITVESLEEWDLQTLAKLKDNVKGFLVQFPLHFLKDEQMSPTILNKEFMIPRNVFL
ncbi:Phospholipase [Balamuthia mandrillaris]